VIYAILQPASLVGMLAAFLLAVSVRASVQVWLAARLLRHRVGLPAPNPRRDIDPFGAIAAVFGGTGWGRRAPLPETRAVDGQPRRRVAVLLAGPAAVIGLGMVVLVGYRVGYPSGILDYLYPSDVLRGVSGPAAEQFLVSLGVGLLCFGVLALVPLPPLDGWWLLWQAIRRPGEGAQKARFWLEERNIGVLLLLVMVAFPLGTPLPLLLMVLDVVVHPLMRLVAT
jgi:hypothetical protein